MIHTHLIIGRLGSGKSSLIQQLIENNHADEKWAVIVNEFGQVGIDAAILASPSTENTQITEIAGGCICCAAQSQLRVQLTTLIRQFKPQRIIIEATGLGHPASIVDLLRDDYFKNIITIQSIITVIDISLFIPTYNRSDKQSPLNTPAFIQQAQLADIVVFNKQDLATDAAKQQAKKYFQQIYPEKIKFTQAEHGRVDSDLLTLESNGSAKLTFTSVVNKSLQVNSEELAFHDQVIERFFSDDNEMVSVGFILPAEMSFQRQQITEVFNQLSIQCQPLLIRIKAVLNTGKFWHSFNTINQQVEIRESFYRRDNRLEIITANRNIDINELSEKLLSCIR